MNKLKLASPLSLRMPLVLRKKVEEMATKERRTLTNMTILIIEQGLQCLEDAGDGREHQGS